MQPSPIEEERATVTGHSTGQWAVKGEESESRGKNWAPKSSLPIIS